MIANLLSAWLAVAAAAAVVIGSVIRHRDWQVPRVEDGPPRCTGCDRPLCGDHPWQGAR